MILSHGKVPFPAAGHGNLPNDNDHENDFHDDIYSGVSMSPNTDMLRKSRLEKFHENGGVAMRKGQSRKYQAMAAGKS